ncbi:MAG TPA: YdcF family protein [Egibacteraceae bacterium]|nr:YdcF family protein [Egibacteraceae bacterium]
MPFVWPPTEVPPQADAIVVLSGDHGERLPVAMRLLERGVAPTLVFVGTLDRAEEEVMCRDGWRGREVLCVRPDPDSTRDEARATARLGRERQWGSVVIVTSSHHTVRSALLFRRCVDGEVFTAAGRANLPFSTMVRLTLREWMATAYLLTLERGC